MFYLLYQRTFFFSIPKSFYTINGSEGKREEVKEVQDNKRDEGTFAEKYHVDVPGISQERLEELQRESKEQDKEEESARG